MIQNMSIVSIDRQCASVSNHAQVCLIKNVEVKQEYKNTFHGKCG